MKELVGCPGSKLAGADFVRTAERYALVNIVMKHCNTNAILRSYMLANLSTCLGSIAMLSQYVMGQTATIRVM